MNINLVVIGGHLCRDPELRVTPKGTAICNFSIANNRNYKNDSGQAMSRVSYLDVSAWGKTGELIAKHFTKGDPILLRGRLEMDEWEDKATQQKRTKLKLVINFPEGGFEFVQRKSGGPEPEQEHAMAGHPGGGDQLTGPVGGRRASSEEDVPF